MKEIQIVAHRGANNLAPENTMAAIKLCREMGVHYIELDVRSSRDGVFYNFHDSILERTTDGSGEFAGCLSGYIDSLDAGSPFSSRFAGEKVPRIRDILEEVRDQFLKVIDLKCDMINLNHPDLFLDELRRLKGKT